MAIILNAYQSIIAQNPDANDASQFISMVIVQAKKATTDAITNKAGRRAILNHDIKPHVLANNMVPLAQTEYWCV